MPWPCCTSRSLPPSLARVFLGGDFTTPRQRLAAFDFDGNLLPNPNLAINNTVFDMESNGTKLFIAGSFSVIGGASRRGVAIVDIATGTVDPVDFGIVKSNAVKLYGGKLYVLTNADVRRYTLSGTLEATLATINGSENYALEVYNNVIYIGGTFTTVNGVSRSRVAALDMDGNLLAGWNPGASSQVNSIRQIGGYLFATGQFQTFGGQSHICAAAITPAGAVNAWATGIRSDITPVVYSVTQDASGRIILGGNIARVGSSLDDIYRYAFLGAWDSTYQVDGNTNAYDLQYHNGRLYAAGAWTLIQGVAIGGLIVLDDNAAIQWPSLGIPTTSRGYCVLPVDETTGGTPPAGGVIDGDGTTSVSSFSDTGCQGGVGVEITGLTGTEPFIYKWELVSGPAGITFSTPTAANTSVNISNSLVEYAQLARLRCTVTNVAGSTVFEQNMVLRFPTAFIADSGTPSVSTAPDGNYLEVRVQDCYGMSGDGGNIYYQIDDLGSDFIAGGASGGGAAVFQGYQHTLIGADGAKVLDLAIAQETFESSTITFDGSEWVSCGSGTHADNPVDAPSTPGSGGTYSTDGAWSPDPAFSQVAENGETGSAGSTDGGPTGGLYQGDGGSTGGGYGESGYLQSGSYTQTNGHASGTPARISVLITAAIPAQQA